MTAGKEPEIRLVLIGFVVICLLVGMLLRVQAAFG